MSKRAGIEWAPAGSDVFNVDALARRYARVLLSRRVLRAFAAGTLSAALLLVVSVVVPLGLALTAAGAENRSAWWLVLVALLVLAGAAGAAGLVVLYVRALSALARGSRRVIAAVVIVAGIWIALVGFSDLMSAIFPEEGVPLY